MQRYLQDQMKQATLETERGRLTGEKGSLAAGAETRKKDQDELNRLSNEYWKAQDAGLPGWRRSTPKSKRSWDKLKQRRDISESTKTTGALSWSDVRQEAPGRVQRSDQPAPPGPRQGHGRVEEMERCASSSAAKTYNEAIKEDTKSLEEYSKALGKAFVELGKLNESRTS